MPLIYRDKGKSGTQLEVLSGTLPVANISKAMFSQLAGGEAYWRWNFEFQHGPRGFKPHGHAKGLGAAKDGVEQNWQLWLTAARLTESI